MDYVSICCNADSLLEPEPVECNTCGGCGWTMEPMDDGHGNPIPYQAACSDCEGMGIVGLYGKCSKCGETTYMKEAEINAGG